MNNTTSKLKNHINYPGVVFAVAVALFGFVMTWVIFDDAKLFAQMESNLYDFGMDVMGAFISAALFCGCLKQAGNGMTEFRVLNVLVSVGFLVNMLYCCTMGVPEQRAFTFVFVSFSKLIDLVMIYMFYRYVRESLSFKGRLTSFADRGIPVLFILEVVVILSNIICPVTFSVNDSGIYRTTGAYFIEDIYLIIAAAITTILIIRSTNPRNQKVAALTFVFLPLIIYATTFGEFGNASQYGMILMSLIIMYCIIFNYNSNKLASTQTELNMGTEIQTGMLPSIFPAFPSREEFDLYASMDPAKEVGGDFYDFFMIDDDHLGIVIADVSGKGVPAALFMMISRTVIQNYAKLGISASEVFNKANEALCIDNKMKMFVTAWIGIMEISTGRMKCVNAGHQYPAIFHDGQFELFKDRHGLVLGAMDGMKYKEYELQLDKGDKIFVYTDGVAEAMNTNDELFGTDRMIEALNTAREADPKEVLRIVRKSVDRFVGVAEQFDDLTMICLEYKGSGSNG